MLRDAVLVETEPDRLNRRDVHAFHTMAAPVEVDGRRYVARMKLKETTQGNRFYDHSLTELVPVVTASAAPGSAEADAGPETAPQGCSQPRAAAEDSIDVADLLALIKPSRELKKSSAGVLRKSEPRLAAGSCADFYTEFGIRDLRLRRSQGIPGACAPSAAAAASEGGSFGSGEDHVGQTVALFKALAAGERWITVHRHGEEKGQPILIKPAADGTFFATTAVSARIAMIAGQKSGAVSPTARACWAC